MTPQKPTNGNGWRLTSSNLISMVAIGAALFLGLQPHIMGERADAAILARIEEKVSNIEHDLEELNDSITSHQSDTVRHEGDAVKRQRIRDVLAAEYDMND